jgi:pimeloyl-ACP methyl ester carboxylesterase
MSMNHKGKMIIKKIGKVLAILIGCLTGLSIILFLIFLAVSPGKIEPFLDTDGNVLKDSISEIISLEIGGIDQKMIIRGKNRKNPVILFLHGGPGSTEFPFSGGLRAVLENDFTICWWEQRGAGMSYSADIDPSTMTLDQLVSDTAELSNYLRAKFDQDKIFLIGHSWGTFLGMYVVQKYPELFHAYIGIGQISNQFESEKIAYDYMLEWAQETKDKNLGKALSGFSLTDENSLTMDYMAVRSTGMNKLGIGLRHNDMTMGQMIFDMLTCRAYTFREKINWIIGSRYSLEHLWAVVPATNLNNAIPVVEVPVFITQGKYDYQVSTTLAEQYFENLDAPYKQFYVFENSAHSPCFEEPEKFAYIMKNDVLSKSKDK